MCCVSLDSRILKRASNAHIQWRCRSRSNGRPESDRRRSFDHQEQLALTPRGSMVHNIMTGRRYCKSKTGT